MPQRVIFIHQNMPGQFRHLMAYCAESSEFEVVVVGEKQRVLANFPRAMHGVTFHVYDLTDIPREQVPSELWTTTNAMRRGRAVALCLQNIRDTGFRPDVIYGHPGWGDMLHVRDVFPAARIVNYGEFYFNRDGQDLNFDPEFQPQAMDVYRVRTDNMTQLVSLVDSDACISPTQWQRSRYPELLRKHITVIHDGIDVDVVKPDPTVRLTLPQSGLVLDRNVPVITYVSRNLEPYRGFHVFMRALPGILSALPDAQVLIVGGDEVSYSSKLPGSRTYREMMLAELGARLDLSRVHFLGRVPYEQYLRILQVSRVHVYLTYPFVLSWSMLEAMAVGAVVVGSSTPPVQEVIVDGVNGFLVDFFSPQELGEAVCRACRDFDELGSIRQAAMETVTQRFDLRNDCLRRQLALLFPESDANATVRANA
ncbi:glycosyltransferase [Rhodanobacter sp. AS-Z3]|uniref:glycosyltransferase n=1 Tax=Rhodanobacter sp. AS-Z3 TaxID=3031330 RepID=UPI00247B134B|nr:glycosyltransferase [Rhodanobacter sp. AS-Z3]WEN13774.1 glycosyltransferase [Rhodanobacter sp. AS-Z3]